MNRRPTACGWTLLLALVATLFPCTTPISRAAGAAAAPTQPASRPTTQPLYCVDARKLDFPRRILLSSLQALANKDAPVLFVLLRREDSSWRTAMEKQLGQTFRDISLDDALARFGENKPQVVYDGKKRWSLSIATTLAGVHEALLTSRPLEDHDVAFDCRGRWSDKSDAYTWAMAQLVPRCDRRQLCYLDEVLPWLRDYAIQQKLFTFNLDPLNNAEDTKLLEQILHRFPAQTRVFGWATGAYADKSKGQDGVSVENALVSRLSRRGMMLLPADFAGNLSFYARTGPYGGKLAQQRARRELKFQPDKRYVLLVNSDGDNIQMDLADLRSRWQEPRPKTPVAWTISPQLADVAPAVLATYYQEAAALGGNDEFIAGPSGCGYVNPGSMNPAHLEAFIRSTRRACDLADIHSIAILDQGSRPPAQIERFINAYAGAQFDALWLIAMPMRIGVAHRTAYASERIRIPSKSGKELADSLKQLPLDPPFTIVYGGITASLLRELTENLNDSCIIVSPTELAELIRQWKHPP